MKKEKKIKKSRFASMLAEAVGEIVFTFVFFGIGALVLMLFGAGDNLMERDLDLVALIGIVSLLALFVIFKLILVLIKKIFKKKTAKKVTKGEDGEKKTVSDT